MHYLPASARRCSGTYLSWWDSERGWRCRCGRARPDWRTSSGRGSGRPGRSWWGCRRGRPWARGSWPWPGAPAFRTWSACPGSWPPPRSSRSCGATCAAPPGACTPAGGAPAPVRYSSPVRSGSSAPWRGARSAAAPTWAASLPRGGWSAGRSICLSLACSLQRRGRTDD